MAGGMSVLALMLVRAAVRLFTARPRDASTGYAFADRLAPLSHYASYVLVVLMVATGYATALKAGLPEIVFGNSGGPLPPRFDVYRREAATIRLTEVESPDSPVREAPLFRRYSQSNRRG